MSQPQLVEILQLNGVDPRALAIERNTIDMAVFIADGMTNGSCEDCPICGMTSLVWCAGRITCWGFVDGTARCPYRCLSENAKRFAWNLPPAIAAMSFLQPEGQPVSAVAVGGSHQSQSCADKVAAMKVPELKAKLAEVGFH